MHTYHTISHLFIVMTNHYYIFNAYKYSISNYVFTFANINMLYIYKRDNLITGECFYHKMKVYLVYFFRKKDLFECVFFR